MKEETHQPAKIYRYEVSIVKGPDPVSLDVHIYNKTLSFLVSSVARSWGETHILRDT